MEVGRRAGIRLEGVSAPMHFLSRYQAQQGPVFVDAYAGGRTLSQRECVHWLQTHTGLPYEHLIPTLRTATPRNIVIRMLMNLKRMHCQRHDWRLAVRVQQRLVALNPADVNGQRDLGLLALQADVPGVAYDALAQCLASPQCEETERLQKLLCKAERAIASRN